MHAMMGSSASLTAHAQCNLSACQQRPMKALVGARYPGDKPSGTMWTSSCSAISFDYAGSGPTAFSNIAQCGSGGCANIVNHHCLSSDGQSGSGMWDPDYVLRAVLSGKVQSPSLPASPFTCPFPCGGSGS